MRLPAAGLCPGVAVLKPHRYMKLQQLLIFLLALQLTASGQKHFSMEEAVLGLRNELAVENFRQLAWMPGTDRYTVVREHAAGEVLLAIEVPSMKSDTLLDLKAVNRQLWGHDSLKKLPEIRWLDHRRYWFSLEHHLYRGIAGDPRSPEIWKVLPEGSAQLTVETHTESLAYTHGNALHLIRGDGRLKTFGRDSGTAIRYGQSVHRNEFGISGGIFFSPKGNHLAFYRMDERGVEDYPVVDWSVTPARSTTIKYPMAGRRSHEVRIGVYHMATDETIYLDIEGPADQYLTAVTWSPDEQHLYVAVLNRNQDHLKLNRYNARTGALEKTLFEEKQDKYVEPQHSLFFLPGNGSEFIWRSQRDGFMHLYRYNTEGHLLNQVTKGPWVVNDILGVHAAGKQIFIASSQLSPLQQNIFSVHWENGEIRRMDRSDGVHTAVVNDSGTYWLDRFSSDSIPHQVRVGAIHAAWDSLLLDADDPLARYDRPKVEVVELAAADGTPLYGKVIYPPDFDAAKRYPVIVYLYNGPHVQLVRNSFPASGNLWFEYLAQRGYLVFTMDGRGSSNRGLAFEQATFRRLGTVEMEDQLRGVQYLKSLPFVDSTRLGVHGWSYGGFMTTSLMLRHPGVFKVGVAGGPVIDWSMYEVMYTERYMDSPEQNPEGYAESNLADKVKNLQGKLLLIHGAQDDVVVWQHSMKFLRACIKEGVQPDYFVYPAHPHNVRGKDRVHLMQKITNYFDTYLK